MKQVYVVGSVEKFFHFHFHDQEDNFGRNASRECCYVAVSEFNSGMVDQAALSFYYIVHRHFYFDTRQRRLRMNGHCVYAIPVVGWMGVTTSLLGESYRFHDGSMGLLEAIGE